MRKFGLIGFPLSHSFSARYFAEKFEREGLRDVQYDLYPLEGIDLLPGLLEQQPLLRGLNVTIPYKESVLKYLHTLDQQAAEAGACNCILIRDKSLKGFNTDITGFRESLLRSLRVTPESALVLGTGGASKAVCFALDQLRIPYRMVSRKAGPEILSYEQLSVDQVRASALIINTTPLGMYPDTEKAPPIPYEGIGPEHLLFDLVYNPPLTRFMQEGLSRKARVKNGEEMLQIQAEESWKIWNA